ncbi:hypothetical protein C2S51_022888 [Perilla frutescens var. frutescens]|nr:hypothetical protein C2S51_022888 [Perilla frutescens var. frutescens]
MKSKGKKKKAVINKEEPAENWCFVCKDGGFLRICDYKDCLKSYHHSCVGKDDSFLESDDHWACSWHTCFICHKCSYLHCYTCTKAVCRRCLPDADLSRVKGQYGFCNYCLKLASLIEDRKDYNSDGENVDFRDRETYEGLFMEYYNIIKEEEGFELGNLHATKDGVKTAEKSESGSEENDDEEEDQISDYDGAEHVKKCRRTSDGKRSGRKKFEMKTPIKSNKNDFIGWGSRSLIDFLSSIGKRTDEKLSERDVTSIVNEYVKENKLLDPQKTKMIICDAQLQSLFKKRRMHKNKVCELLESHFAENCDESEEDDVGYDSEDDYAGIVDIRKRQRKLDMERKSSAKELADDVQLGCFASIVVENVKLVYLRRSLLLEMLKQPELFKEKVVGCFVRVKSDPYDYHSRYSHQLMRVRGVGRVSIDQNNMEAILLFSAVPKEISTNLLSDDDFSKEECEELTRKVLAGQLERPTVEDLQRKANIVHADITKHYLEKKRRLQNPMEVSKLLENVPKVIPDLHELNSNSEDILNDMNPEKDSPKSILQCNSSVANEGWQEDKASEEKTRHCNASSPERTSRKPSQPTAKLKNNKAGGEDLEMCSQETPHVRVTRSSHKASDTVVVELLSDDANSNEGKAANVHHENQNIDDSIWCIQGPNGERKKYSFSVLKQWSETSVYASKFKVWKEDENEENAVWLREAIGIAFPKK